MSADMIIGHDGQPLHDWAAPATPSEGSAPAALVYAEEGEALARLADEQAALRRVATLVARDAAPAEIFAAVSAEVDRVFDLDPATFDVAGVVRFEPGPELLVVGVSRSVEAVSLGLRFPPEELFAPTHILRTGRSARVGEDDLASVGGEVADFLRHHGYLSQVASPIVVEGRLWGAVSVNARNKLPSDTEERLERFTELVATAIANAESRRTLHALADEQAALRRVATLVARDAPPGEVFDAVAMEVGKLLDTDITVVGRYDGDGAATAIGCWSATPGGVPVGTRSVLGGRNVLTIVAETERPARVDGYHDASGEAAEIARRHGWRSSIAAPIIVEDRVWGVTLVATRRPEPFPAGAEERLAAFTDLISTAVANTQAHDELRRYADEQAALGRVATLVAAGAAPEQVFTAVVDEASRLLGLERIELVRYDGDATGTVIAASGDHPFPAGSTWSLDDPSVMATVARTTRAARIDDYSSLNGEIARTARVAGFQSAIGAPMTVEGRLWGVIIAISTDPEPIPERSEARLGQFTDLVATAVANAESSAELAASRRRIVAAGDEARRRIERDLHDGIQQRLIALTFGARAMTRRPADELPDLAAELAEGLKDASDELREVSRGIHPSILTEAGLGPALRALSRRSEVPVDVDVRLDERLPAPVEAAAYYIASEAITNVAKHAYANLVELIAAHDDGVLTLEVRDDGVGGVDARRGSGILGLTDRVEALGGTISILSPPRHGTTLSVRLPITT